MLIALQSGHKNIKQNSDPILATETGANGEIDFNWAVTQAIASLLIKRGFQVQIDDANANTNPETIGKDFSLYLAIHANSEPQGGNAVAPDPSVDASNIESNRIATVINSVYFPESGITNNGQVTSNETFYYMWNVLTAKTPCVLIECGALQDAHDKVILADTARVATALAKAICKAFNIAYDQPSTPITPTDIASITAQLTAIQKNYDEAEKMIVTLNQHIDALNAQIKVQQTTPPSKSVVLAFLQQLLS